jgi:predicted anti-sigma-YlaC factor YlaD
MKKKRLTCKETAEYICVELDEKINSPKCREIKEHLKNCPNCTSYLDSLKKTVGLYRKYSAPKLSAKCRKELFTKLKLGE